MLALISERRDDITRINNDIEELRSRLRAAEEAEEHTFEEEVHHFVSLDGEIEELIAQRRTGSDALQEERRRYTIRTNLLQSQKNEIDRQIRAYTVEMHKKYSLAVACFIMLLVGLPIGMMTKTSGVGVAIMFSGAIFSVYYTFIVFGEQMGKRGDINPALSMWFPCIIFFMLAVFLIYIAKKEKSFDTMILWRWITNRFKVIGLRFKRGRK
jgi:lipopolysaccharide export LptBFGC system permease protein LptF